MLNIEESLSLIGLSKNEIKTYIALTRYGKLSALENAKKTGIHRSNSYDALHSLMEKGFVSQVMDGSRAVFIAREPETLNDYLKQQERELGHAVDELKELSQGINLEEGVDVSTGLFSVRETFRSVFSCGTDVEIYGITDRTMSRIGEGYFREIYDHRVKNRVPVKAICNIHDPHCNVFLKDKKYSDVKFLPDKYESDVVTILCDQRVILVVFSEMPLVISITNKKVHDAYKKYFEILWRKARE